MSQGPSGTRSRKLLLNLENSYKEKSPSNKTEVVVAFYLIKEAVNFHPLLTRNSELF